MPDDHPAARRLPPWVAPWRLELGRIDGHGLAIEHAGRELARSFEAPPGEALLSPSRVALVQPGAQVEQAPWSDAPASLHAARCRFPPPPLLGMRAYVRLTAKCGPQALVLDLPTSLTAPSHRSFEPRKATP